MVHKTYGIFFGAVLAALGLVLLGINYFNPAQHLVRDGFGFAITGVLVVILCLLIDRNCQKLR